MNLSTFIAAGLACIIPISELRGGIPIARAGGMDPFVAYFFCVAANILVVPIVLLFIQTLHKLLLRFGWYARFSEKLIERARRKVKKKVDKFGYIGLVIFVALPLPFTGAYTGALGAWILGMDMKKSFFAVALGVLIAGVIVSVAVALGLAGFEAAKFFYKGA
jgi:uncharacterized membrane protein